MLHSRNGKGQSTRQWQIAIPNSDPSQWPVANPQSGGRIKDKRLKYCLLVFKRTQKVRAGFFSLIRRVVEIAKDTDIETDTDTNTDMDTNTDGSDSEEDDSPIVDYVLLQSKGGGGVDFIFKKSLRSVCPRGLTNTLARKCSFRTSVSNFVSLRNTLSSLSTFGS